MTTDLTPVPAPLAVLMRRLRAEAESRDRAYQKLGEMAVHGDPSTWPGQSLRATPEYERCQQADRDLARVHRELESAVRVHREWGVHVG